MDFADLITKIKDTDIEKIEEIIRGEDSVLDEIVHEVLSIQASNINNSGVRAQVEFLIEEGIYEDSDQVLDYVKVCHEDTSN